MSIFRKNFSVPLLRALFIFSTVTNTFAQTLTLKKQNAIVASMNLEELQKQSKLDSLKVTDRNSFETATYSGFWAQDVFDRHFGTKWSEAKELTFVCKDGYKAKIPAKLFKKWKAFLAVGKADGSVFELVNRLQNSTKAELGPVYVVWDTEKNPEISQASATYWPYQVVEVDLATENPDLDSQTQAGSLSLAPPAGSGRSAQRGYTWFKQLCIQCHALNSIGGTVGPDLNYPRNITEILQPQALRWWLEDPLSVRPKTAMPGVPKNLKNRKAVILDLEAYLRSIKNKKMPNK